MTVYSLSGADGIVCPLFVNRGGTPSLEEARRHGFPTMPDTPFYSQTAPRTGFRALEGSPAEIFAGTGTAVALGNFDGVHVGHAELLRRTAEYARESGLVPVVRTFSSDCKTDRLTSDSERLELFAHYGIKYAVIDDFEKLRIMPAAVYVRSLLVRDMNCRVAVCGFNHHFGHGAVGTSETLSALMLTSGGRAHVVQPIFRGGMPISSTRVRAALSDCDTKLTIELLGRPYSAAFEVIHGRQIGRTIGLPTINQIFPANRHMPGNGVYAGLCEVVPGVYRPSVINIGRRPTVGGDDSVVCETHILDWSGDLYGRTPRVFFMRYLRPEEKFDSLESLKNRIALDIAAVRAMEL